MKTKLFFLIGLIAMLSTSCTNNYSQGERIGIITKFSEKGLLWKSNEGELKVAPNIATAGMVGQYETFEFSIDNDEKIKCVTPVDSIKLYAKLGIPVVVFYQEVKGYNWLRNRGDTDHFIKTISRAK